MGIGDKRIGRALLLDIWKGYLLRKNIGSKSDYMLQEGYLDTDA
jgi:hypothetical protein